MRLINNTKFEFESNYLLDLDKLDKVSIESIHNCCNKFNQTLQFISLDNAKLCTALYCNYSGQNEVCNGETKFPQNCINPKGSYYYRISELYIKLNGIQTNILSRTYNTTQDSEIEALKVDIAKKLKGVTFQVTRYYDANDYLCLKIDFVDLPTGIIPGHFILRNEDSCYVQQFFDCLTIVPNSKCIESELILNRQKSYILKALIVDDVEFDLDVNLDIIGLSDTQAEIELLDIQNLLNQNGKPTLIFTVILDGDNIIIRHTDSTSINVSLYYNENGVYLSTKFRCTLEDKLPVISVYKTRIYYDSKDILTDIYAVNVSKPEFLSPVNALSSPLLFSSIENLIDLLKINNSTAVVTVVHGGDYIDITVTNSNVPMYDVVIFKNGEYKSYPFAVTELINYSGSYNSDIVEYAQNKLYIKNRFFGFTDKFEDGIYTFNINIVTKTQVYLYKFCKFVFNSQCLLSSITDESVLSKAIVLLDLINYSIDCGCDCEKACEYYAELTDLLYNVKCK